MLVVIYLEAMPAGIQAALDHEVDARVVAPGVKHQCTVDPHPSSIVDAYGEAIDTLLEVELAGPAHTKVVRRNAGGRAADAPIEGDLEVVADNRGLAEQVAVGVVLATPLRERDRPLPPQVNRGVSGALVVFHAQAMPAGLKITLAACRAQATVFPIVDHQHTVHPDAHTVVHPGYKTKQAGVEPLAACPAHAEEIRGNTPGRGAARSPVETNSRIDTHHLRRAQQVAVGVVLAQPAVDHDRRRRGRRHGRGGRPGPWRRRWPHG